MEQHKKVAIVTGASRGIGRSIAGVLASQEIIVVINYLNSENEAQKLLSQINDNGGQAVLFKADVSVESEVKKLVEFTVSQFGTIDCLVNNAGKIIQPGNSSTTEPIWNDTLDINVKSAWLMIRQVAPVMVNGGAIVNITSYVGQLGSQYVLPYGVAKAGLINLTKAYAKELSPKIRVNSVSPGNINTTMTQSAGADFISKTINNTPLKRLGETIEVANAVAFLLSDQASFITGVNLDVDGGYLLLN